MKRGLTFAVTAAVALAFVATSLAAGGSILKGYGGEGGKVVQNVSPHTGVSATPNGILPFTGLDISLVVAGALLLVLTGAVVRRTARNRA